MKTRYEEYYENKNNVGLFEKFTICYIGIGICLALYALFFNDGNAAALGGGVIFSSIPLSMYKD